MSQTFATIATFDQYQRAFFFKNMLEEEGIPCFLGDKQQANQTLGRIKLKVLQVEAELASKLLKKWHNLPYLSPEGKALKCPECNSQQLNGNYSVFNNLIGIIKYIISRLTSANPTARRKQTQCLKCKHVF